MAQLPPVNVVFTAVDRMSAPIRRMSQSFKSSFIAGSAMTGAAFAETDKKISAFTTGLNTFGARTKAAGANLTAGITLPVLGLGYSIGQVAGNFQASMNKVQNLTGATGAEFDKLKNQAKDLGATTKFSASEAADAMGFLGMAGFDTNEILEATPEVLKLAAASGMELGESADIVSNIMSGYNIEAKDLAATNDVLVKTFQKSNLNLSMLGAAFEKVGPSASAAGVDLKDTALAIGLLGNAGIQGETAGTVLRNTLLRVTSDTTKAKEAFKKLKLKPGDLVDAKGNLKSFELLINKLRETGASSRDLADIFGDETGPALLAAINQPIETLNSLKKEINENQGAAQAAADNLNKGFNGAMASMKSAAEGLLITIGESGILELMTKLISKVTGLIRWVNELNPGLLKWGVLLGAAAAVIGPLLLGVGALAASFSSIIAFWPALVAGFTFLTGVIMPAIISVIGTIVSASIPALIGAFGALSTAIMSIPVVGWIIAAVAALIAGVVLIVKNWDAVKQFFVNLFEFITSGFNSVVDLISSAFKNIWDNIPAPVRKIIESGLNTFGFSGPSTAAADTARNKNNNLTGVIDINHNNAPAGVTMAAAGAPGLSFNTGKNILGK